MGADNKKGGRLRSPLVCGFRNRQSVVVLEERRDVIGRGAFITVAAGSTVAAFTTGTTVTTITARTAIADLTGVIGK